MKKRIQTYTLEQKIGGAGDQAMQHAHDAQRRGQVYDFLRSLQALVLGRENALVLIILSII